MAEALFFFFSSRRRHTRWTGDWSSDVCSSDLDRRRAHRLRAIGNGCPVAHRHVLLGPRRLGAKEWSQARQDLARPGRTDVVTMSMLAGKRSFLPPLLARAQPCSADTSAPTAGGDPSQDLH